MKLPPTILIQEDDFHNAWARAVRYVLRDGRKITIGDASGPKPIRDACVLFELTGDAIRQIEDRELHPQFPFQHIDPYCEEFTREYLSQYIEKPDQERFSYLYFERLAMYGDIDQMALLRKCLATQIDTGIGSNRHHAITWQAKTDLGSTSPPCFDDETEVLTSSGWKLFRHVTYEDDIATLAQNDEIEYQKPSNILSYPFNGEMVSASGASLDFKVTPNHMMYIGDKHGSFRLSRADELPKECYIKSDATWTGGERVEEMTIGDKIIKMDNFLRFLAIYLSDGDCTINNGRYRVRISQKKNVIRYRKILNALHPSFNVIEECDKNCDGCIQFVINNKELATYVSQFGQAHHKFIPEFVNHLPSDQIKTFLETYEIGDAHTRGTTVRYCTVSKTLASDMQELVLKSGNGRSADIWKRTGIEYYEVKDRSFKNGRHLHRDSMVDMVEYCGEVYCVEVPNHIIYVRRNGKAMWCGNCLQRIWIRHLGDQSVEVHLTWRSRDLYTAWQVNIIALIDMLNREVIRPNNCRIVKLVDYADSLHIYESDKEAEKVKPLPASPQKQKGLWEY